MKKLVMGFGFCLVFLPFLWMKEFIIQGKAFERETSSPCYHIYGMKFKVTNKVIVT